MPIKWYICPLIETVVGDRKFRKQKITQHLEPGTDDGSGELGSYSFSGVASSVKPDSGEHLSLIRVTANDFSPLDSDTDFVPVFEEPFLDTKDEINKISKTPRMNGVSQSEISRMKARVSRKGFQVGSVGLDTPTHEILALVGRDIEPSFDARKMITR